MLYVITLNSLSHCTTKTSDSVADDIIIMKGIMVIEDITVMKGASRNFICILKQNFQRKVWSLCLDRSMKMSL